MSGGTDATALLQRLIRLDTVNPPGNEAAALELLLRSSRAAGFECDLLGAVPDRPNLVARLAGLRMGRASASSAMSTPCSPTRPSGASIRGRVSSGTGSCGVAARST